MKIRRFVSLALFIQVLVLAAVTSSLAQNTPSGISIDIQPTSYVTVSRAAAVQEGGRLKISGVLTRPGEVHLPGHVDLLILDKEGALLEKKRIRVPGLSSNRKGFMDIRFGTVLELTPPAGARAVIRYHAPGDPRGLC